MTVTTTTTTTTITTTIKTTNTIGAQGGQPQTRAVAGWVVRPLPGLSVCVPFPSTRLTIAWTDHVVNIGPGQMARPFCGQQGRPANMPIAPPACSTSRTHSDTSIDVRLVSRG